ncbi:hypothetical protein PHYC_03210 [Phycisphaerales bacterium]|nr:hypothetical protein PHYC_03210 [Phycisphaerales bacterium]
MKSCHGVGAALIIACVCVPATAQDAKLPEVVVSADNARIDRSCRVVIEPGAVIADSDGDGVIHIVADGVTVEFAPGSVLRGAIVGAGAGQTPWDQLAGIGVRVSGRKDVRLVNAAVEGFKVGVYADRADRFEIADARITDIYRQHLRSTPAAEDGGDWLWPHENDNREWMTNYGAAVVVERCEHAVIRGVRVRRSQNGIVIDRVNHAKVYDNDCSFLSGWGLAMWRSCDNVISRNALDFCIRGHSEGVYNRGQDSAGILCFEQCSRNVFVENSLTHGGDGFFGFAGKEAIGEKPAPPGFDYEKAGCNDNEFRGNDFSYAAAHGLELTFSKGNVVRACSFDENAICGIWAGYSRGMVIVDNHFEGNGGMAYGLENGAINIEHGSDNRIAVNDFVNNRTAIHLWWDDDGTLLEMPGVKAGYKGVSGNQITGNTIDINERHPFRAARDANLKMTALRLRSTKPEQRNVHTNDYAGNTVEITIPNGAEFDVTQGCEPRRPHWAQEEFDLPPIKGEAIGRSRPVGAMKHLSGRAAIVMDEWGPWDHQTPLIRARSRSGSEHVWEVFTAGGKFAMAPETGGVAVRAEPSGASGPVVLHVTALSGVHAYRIPLEIGGKPFELAGTIVGAAWDIKAFAWDEKSDPRKDLAAWRGLAEAPGAVATRVESLRFAYGHGGPRDQACWKEFGARAPGGDHFGTIARATLPLPKGRWRLSTLSDDGVRVTVNGKPVIENWTWHAPTGDQGVFDQPSDADVSIVVEHFEIDGYAVLELVIERSE